MTDHDDDIPEDAGFILRNVGERMHDRLWTVCRRLPTDFEPYGKRYRNAPDCSCGCRHFAKLPGALGMDWGVCFNPRSPRSGLLTFEHQGCEVFEPAEADSDDEFWRAR